MRPIKLIMRTFGAYADEEVIDFRQLGGRNFFLIHGTTGSGKTTILDAICFALYGTTSGGERDNRMRSDHAGPETPSEVIFDFSLGRALYRVARQPEQELKKKRGEGTTVQPPKATLWRRAPGRPEGEDGTVLESRWSRVTEAVTDLLGFQCDQFRQVVVLPQGKFRELLTAPTKDRQEILRVLFQTQEYEAIQERLKAAKLELGRQLDELMRQTRRILAESGVESAEALEQRSAGLAGEIGHLRERREALVADRDARQKSLDEARAIAARLQERAEAEAALGRLEADRARHEARREELRLARLALPLTEAEQALEQYRQDARQAEDQLAAARQSREAAATAHETATRALAAEQDRAPEGERLQEEITLLRGLLPRAQELTDGRARLGQAAERLAATNEDHEQARATAGELARQIAGLEEQREALQALAGQLGERQAEADRLKTLAEQLKRLRQARADLDQAARELADGQARAAQARQSLDADKARLEAAETLWLEGQAALLAGSLAPGEPCPVCGAREHPAPAAARHDMPEQAGLRRQRETIKMAEERLAGLQEQCAAAQGVVAGLEARKTELENALGGDHAADPAELETRARRVKRELTQAREAAAALPALTAQLNEARNREVSLKQRLEALAVERQQAAVAEAGLRAQVEALERDLPEALRAPGRLEAAISRQEKQFRALREAIESAQRRERETGEALSASTRAEQIQADLARDARRRADDCAASFDIKIKTAGFAEAAQYRAAVRSQRQIEELDQDLRDYANALAAASEICLKARAAAEGLTPPDLPGLEAAVAAIDDQIREVSTREGELNSDLKQVHHWLDDLGETAREQGRQEAQYQVLGKVADVANGQPPLNALNLSFERFIQGVWLDRVLAQASLRLRRMSRERFTLKRAVDPAHGRAAGGLDLLVHDSHTDTDRPAATLSGGESFMASLSLALGLADVVQARAGGIHLETIFVDEGFGALDPEALDTALATLLDLQQGGRLVGIISHVPELKERIDVRLEVTADRHGSHTRFLVN